MADLASDIETNAEGPAEARGDQGSMRQHSLPDQIEADRYLAGKAAVKAGKLGIRSKQMKPPGMF